MFWHILKYIKLKTVSGHTFFILKFKNQKVLKEEIQSSKTLNYPIIDKYSKEVKWGICN